MAATAHKRWSESEIAYLEEHRYVVPVKEMAIKLGRSVQSVHGRMVKDYARRRSATIRTEVGARTPIEIEMEVVPPAYVLHERKVRRSIPATSVTQVQFSDPIDGYSALDAKVRKISVQDALEICALYNGKHGEIVALAATYGVSVGTIRTILDGSFFDRLVPSKVVPREVVDNG